VIAATLAVLSAVVLQGQAFAPLPGIFVIVVCLAINQATYLIGIIRGPEDPGAANLPRDEAHEVPRGGRKDDIPQGHEWQCNA
jgi:hypothetical protein